MAVYSYARVSTARQVSDGESLGVQERTIAGYAMMQGLLISRSFIERGVSGSVPLTDRPEGKALLNTLQTGDTIITAKLDRMFRSALDALGVLADLKARGISLHMVDLQGDVTSNGISKLVFTILSAVAEAERDRIRERITTVKADQKARGHYLGGIAPYGYKVVEGRLVPVADQQEVIAKVRHLRSAGLSLRVIRQKTGAKLSLTALSHICREVDIIVANDKGREVLRLHDAGMDPAGISEQLGISRAGVLHALNTLRGPESGDGWSLGPNALARRDEVKAMGENVGGPRPGVPA